MIKITSLNTYLVFGFCSVRVKIQIKFDSHLFVIFKVIRTKSSRARESNPLGHSFCCPGGKYHDNIVLLTL